MPTEVLLTGKNLCRCWRKGLLEERLGVAGVTFPLSAYRNCVGASAWDGFWIGFCAPGADALYNREAGVVLDTKQGKRFRRTDYLFFCSLCSL